MKNLLAVLCISVGLFACKENPEKKKTTEPQKEQSVEATQEWTALFDGETLAGWHQYNGEGMSDQWAVVDNAMVFTPKENRTYGDGGKNIVTDKEYTNFILFYSIHRMECVRSWKQWNLLGRSRKSRIWGALFNRT